MNNCQSNKIKCPEIGCDTVTRGDNLRRHLKNVHKYTEDQVILFNKTLKSMKRIENSGNVWNCPKENCSTSCSKYSGILSHLSRMHKDEQGVLKKKLEQDKSVHGKLEFVVQILKEDQEKEEKSTLNCVFDNCCKKSANREKLCEHLRNDHNMNQRFQVENEKFDSKAVFDVWLNKRKESTCTTFVSCGTATDNNITTQYFKCSYEGSYDSIATKNRKKKSRKQTGEKCCSAFMRVVKNPDESYSIIACFDHEGHDKLDWAKQKYTDAQISVIKKLIDEKQTNEQIIAKLRREYPDSNRLHYVLNEDIRVIRERFDLFDGRCDKNDLTSIQKLKEEHPEYGIRLLRLPFNSTGQGFILVMILPEQEEALKKLSWRVVVLDETHNITRYDLKLTTMLVMDENDRGVPVGFMLSNCSSTEELRFFFREVKRIFPEFCPEVFMTDEAGAFWNAYVYEFPQNRFITLKLWCRWHVIRALGKRAQETLKAEHVYYVMQLLNLIMRTPSEYTLKSELNKLYSHLQTLDYENARSFAKYFKKRYEKNKKLWCTVYRDNSPVQTSMMAESWNSKIKRERLKNKLQIRVDNLTYNLRDTCLDMMIQRKVEIARDIARANLRSCEQRKLHQLAVKLQLEFEIEETSEESSVFLIEKKNQTVFVVTYENRCICDTKKNSHCENCGVCWSNVTCTCTDQVSGRNCIHCHIAVLFRPSIFRTEKANPDVDDIVPANSETNNEEESELNLELDLENDDEYGEQNENMKGAGDHDIENSDDNGDSENVIDMEDGEDTDDEENEKYRDIAMANITSIKNAYNCIETQLRSLSRNSTSKCAKISSDIAQVFEKIARELVGDKAFKSPGLITRANLGSANSQPLTANAVMNFTMQKKSKNIRKRKHPQDEDENHRQESQICCCICDQKEAPSSSSGESSSELNMQCSVCPFRAHEVCTRNLRYNICSICEKGSYFNLF
ncbi:unnamed protein product [Caenorhabditis angaria]|uniref:C2H2-type domain-containing protein n=1 Tax=Caenorhabditis angaria TaxID=860376 RepID=A0A9P1MSM7_9PELO|nr:unnamed protein product [Caenorhabditis angaria]